MVGNSVAIRIEIFALVDVINAIAVGVIVQIIRNTVIVVIVIQIIRDAVTIGVL